MAAPCRRQLCALVVHLLAHREHVRGVRKHVVAHFVDEGQVEGQQVAVLEDLPEGGALDVLALAQVEVRQAAAQLVQRVHHLSRDGRAPLHIVKKISKAGAAGRGRIKYVWQRCTKIRPKPRVAANQ